jgi:DNA-binding XRE family transcriptional regulator
MRLKQFIKSNGFNSKTFANAIGIKSRTVEAWSRGERLPRWQDAKKIFVFTDNKVTGQDLYDEQIQKQETILQRDKVRQRYLILEEMQMKKLIYDLETHPVFPLLVNGIKIGRYTADFKYKNANGEEVVEDVKSKITKTRDYMLRKKILATYNPPIIISEIL